MRVAVQIRAARAVDGAGVFAVERQNIARAARGIVEVDVRQALPAAPDAEHFAADLATPVNDALDYGIQAGNVTTTGKDTYTFYGHQNSSLVG